MNSSLYRAFVNHIELWLSGAGLVVIWAVPALFGGADVWQVAAFTAVGVGILHGLIFWTVRRRQRKRRMETIREIREMLSDVVKNELAIIRASLPAGEEREQYDIFFDGIEESIEEIAERVDSLSEESLRDWKSEYREALENATVIESTPAAEAPSEGEETSSPRADVGHAFTSIM